MGVGSDDTATLRNLLTASETKMFYVHFKLRGFVLFENTRSHQEFAAKIGDEVFSEGVVQTRDGNVECTAKTENVPGLSAKDTQWLRRRLSR